ncbi:MAG: DUF192 domain-containing protein [Pseudomonadota bacterium]
MRLASLIVLAGVAAASPAKAIECAREEIVVLTEPPVTFEIELAETPDQQARGLMFRPQLARESGMLFVMDPPRFARFWMRNTMISLDLIFIDRAGVVESIAADAVPYSEQSLASQNEVRAVFEINGGLAAELGIQPGTQVIHPIFDEASEPHRCTR